MKKFDSIFIMVIAACIFLLGLSFVVGLRLNPCPSVDNVVACACLVAICWIFAIFLLIIIKIK